MPKWWLMGLRNPVVFEPDDGTGEDDGVVETTVSGGEAETNTGAADSGESTSADKSPTPSESSEEEGRRATPWFNRRISQLTAQKHAAEAAARQATAEAQQLREMVQRQGQSQGQGQPQGIPPGVVVARQEEIAQHVISEAERIAGERAFADECNRVYNNGIKEFGDNFKSNLSQLHTAFGSEGIPRPILEAVLETDNPAKVMMELAKDIDTAFDIASLPPARAAARLVKMAGSGSGSGRKTSNAPPPVTPVVGARGKADDTNLDDDSISMDEWVRRREKQLAARNSR